jgi:hypothetical protein
LGTFAGVSNGQASPSSVFFLTTFTRSVLAPSSELSLSYGTRFATTFAGVLDAESAPPVRRPFEEASQSTEAGLSTEATVLAFGRTPSGFTGDLTSFEFG